MYSPEGQLFWQPRARSWFSSDRACAAWNAKYAWTEAFTAATGNGYKVGAILNESFLAHRVIWAMVYDEWPNVIDHRNGNKQDNSLLNLASVSKQANSQNTKRHSHNQSGISGVAWSRKYGMWRARLYYDGHDRHLGYFKCIAHAVAARKNANFELGFSERHGVAA